VVRRRIASRQALYSLAAVAFALMVALGAAQVSGAHFNDPNYSPGEVPTFDDMTEEQAQEKARDVTKYVEDLSNDIDTAERDGDITHERASEIRADVNRKVGEAKRNYANRKTRSGGNGNGQGNENGNGQGNGKPANGNGAGAPPASGAKPGTGPNSNKPAPDNRPGGRPPAGDAPADPAPDGSAPGGATPGGSAPLTAQPGSGASGLGVAGVFAVSGGNAGDRPAQEGRITSAQRLQALLNGTATDNVGVDVTDNAQLRRLLTQATTGVPIGFQALLMALLFVVALLLVLVLRERRRAQHVERVSQLDYLTGLANREGFDRMLGIEWRRAMRYGHTLGMVFIDLDEFKRFNDSNGHLAGDRLLREVAAVINSEARASDYTARLGGDEFVILCPETDAKGLEALARRLEDASVGLAVSLSIGFTHQMPTDTAPEDLIGRADSAMYQAKAERGSFPVPGGSGSRTSGD
jgi:diguanylate cyclase (GGDEF)-like protein